MRTYRAWTDHHGWAEWQRRPDSIRLIDIETNRYRIVLRLMFRRRPFYLAVVPFFRATRGTTLLRLGRRP